MDGHHRQGPRKSNASSGASRGLPVPRRARAQVLETRPGSGASRGRRGGPPPRERREQGPAESPPAGPSGCAPRRRRGPASSASSISLTKSPLPPTPPVATSRRRSPSVRSARSRPRRRAPAARRDRLRLDQRERARRECRSGSSLAASCVPARTARGRARSTSGACPARDDSRSLVIGACRILFTIAADSASIACARLGRGVGQAGQRPLQLAGADRLEPLPQRDDRGNHLDVAEPREKLRDLALDERLGALRLAARARGCSRRRPACRSSMS